MIEAERAMRQLGAELAQACMRETNEEFLRMLAHVSATIRKSPRFLRFPTKDANRLLAVFRQAAWAAHNLSAREGSGQSI